MANFTLHSPVGKLFATADEWGITSLDFVEESDVVDTPNAHLFLLKEELEAYFAGQLTMFSVSLNPKGTPFQQSVWRVLQGINYGETISYSQEAERLNHPTATRAVANANGKNKIAIVIPCHRVIAKDGTLGGYSAGLWRKEYLLALEKRLS